MQKTESLNLTLQDNLSIVKELEKAKNLSKHKNKTAIWNLYALLCKQMNEPTKVNKNFKSELNLIFN